MDLTPSRDPLHITGTLVAEKYRVEGLIGEGGFSTSEPVARLQALRDKHRATGLTQELGVLIRRCAPPIATKIYLARIGRPELPAWRDASAL